MHQRRAEVRTNRVTGTLSDSHGQFEIKNVPEGAPLYIEVRAFGYLPADTTVVPGADDDRYVFELEPDLVM